MYTFSAFLTLQCPFLSLHPPPPPPPPPNENTFRRPCARYYTELYMNEDKKALINGRVISRALVTLLHENVCTDVYISLFSTDRHAYLRAYLTGGDAVATAATAATDQLRQLGRIGRPKYSLRSHQGGRRVAATAETDQSRRLGRPNFNMACALTSRRRLRDLLETEKVSPK